MFRELKKHTSFLKEHWSARSLRDKVLMAIAIALVIVNFLVLIKNLLQKEPSYEVVKRQDLAQTLKTQGLIVNSAELPLFFSESEKINKINVKTGQSVKKGQILASVDSGSLKKKLDQANKELTQARNHYSQILDGSSNKEITQAKANLVKVQETQATLVEQNRLDFYNNSLEVQVLNIQDSPQPILSGQYKGQEAGQYLITFDKKLNKISYQGLEKGSLKSTTSKFALGKNGLFLQLPNLKNLESAQWQIVIPNPQAPDYDSNLKAYELVQKSAASEIAKAQADLELKQAVARQSEIDSALAKLVIAQDKVDKLNSTFNQSLLIAPVDGVITSIAVKVGDIAQTDKLAMFLEDKNDLYVEAKIPLEATNNLKSGELALVKTNQSVGYRAQVLTVEPEKLGEKKYWDIKLIILDNNNLTYGTIVDLNIKTSQLSRVLTLPAKFIQVKDNVSSVVLWIGKKGSVKEVVTGLRGDNNLVEIKDGLVEGDKVLLPTYKKF